MQKPNDERLIAYLDGELSESENAEVAAWLDDDAELHERAAALTESAARLRAALDPVLREPLPERLIAAAKGEASPKVTDLAAVRATRGLRRFGDPKHWAGIAAAAGISGLIFGGGFGYIAATSPVAVPDQQQAEAQSAAGANWLDNVAGYHKLFVNAGANDTALVDVPPSDSNSDAARKATQKLPADFHLPNLKPWGLVFQGARFLIIEGRPATQLFYTTDNAKLGPITVVVGTSNKPDLAPTLDHRDDLNILYWRHQGHAFALVGTADVGYLWNISQDLAFQLNAI